MAETSVSDLDMFEELAAEVPAVEPVVKRPRSNSRRPKRCSPISICLKSRPPKPPAAEPIAEEPEAEFETAETPESDLDIFEEPAAEVPTTEPVAEEPEVEFEQPKRRNRFDL